MAALVCSVHSHTVSLPQLLLNFLFWSLGLVCGLKWGRRADAGGEDMMFTCMYFWTPTKHFFRASNEDEYNIFFLILALKLKTRISPEHIELYLQIKKISFTFRPRSQQGHVLLWNKKLVPNLNLKRPLQWQLFIWFLHFGEFVIINKALSTKLSS